MDLYGYGTWVVPCKWSYSSRFATSTARTQRIAQLGRPCPRIEPMWSSTWAEIAPKRIQLPSCAMIGPKLDPSGSKLGRSWACYWPKLVWTMLGRSAVPCTFWRGGDPENGPPQLKLHQWTEDCSNRSAPLLNYHASAPLGRADLHLLCNMHMDIYGVYYLQSTWYALYGSVLCILYVHIHIQMDSSHRSILDWCTIVDGYCLKLETEHRGCQNYYREDPDLSLPAESVLNIVLLGLLVWEVFKAIGSPYKFHGKFKLNPDRRFFVDQIIFVDPSGVLIAGSRKLLLCGFVHKIR